MEKIEEVLPNKELIKNEKPKVLFIAFYEYGSMGVRAIKSFIKSKGYETYCIFFKENRMNQLLEPTAIEKKLLLDKINEFNPEVVCVSLRTPQFKIVSNVNKLIRERFQNIAVVWGGAHATICPEECIKHADHVVIGEGEYPLLEFIEKRTSDIRNFWVKEDNKIIKNELRPLIQDLDSLPIPEFTNNCYIENDELINEDPIIKQNKYQIMASRGCPYRCTFCSNSYLHDLFRGKGFFVRKRSVKHTIKELLYVKEVLKNVSVISFLDEVFDIDKVWLEEFLKEYKEKINLPFRIECFPTQVKEENIKILKEAGLRMVTMGIQCGSQRVRSEVYKRFTPDEAILKSANIFKKYKLISNYDYIVDNPYETPQDMMDSINMLLKLPRPYNLNVYSLQNFPKTELTQRIIADGTINELGTGVQGFEKWGARFTAKRSKESLYYICLVSLLSKSFIPKGMVKYLSKSHFFRNHIKPVVVFTNLSNKLKMMIYGGSLILRGEVSFALFLKHLKNFKHIISGQK